jgi:hypothetical protein
MGKAIALAADDGFYHGFVELATDYFSDPIW